MLWVRHGAKVFPTSFRKGSCQNCSANTPGDHPKCIVLVLLAKVLFPGWEDGKTCAHQVPNSHKYRDLEHILGHDLDSGFIPVCFTNKHSHTLMLFLKCYTNAPAQCPGRTARQLVRNTGRPLAEKSGSTSYSLGCK